MASKAWFMPSTLPRLLARFHRPIFKSKQSPNRCIEVWTTTCIVTNFGMQRNRESQQNESQLPRCSMLINPANPFLTGPHSFPYFPRGGPQPENPPNRTAHHIMGYVTNWGGMDVGNGMLFPAATVDGLVHQLGGKQLQKECSQLPEHSLSHVYANQQSQTELSKHQQIKCPVGTAVITSAGDNELRAEYDNIIHCAPPFYKYPPTMSEELQRMLAIDTSLPDEESWAYELLLSCYRHSFELAFRQRKANETKSFLNNILDTVGVRKQLPIPENKRIAVPLLAAGCRGFPTAIAIDAAANASAKWLSQTILDEQTQIEGYDQADCVVAFGLLELSDAQTLSAMIDELL